MVFFKKIICLTLAVFLLYAVCALCALGVVADDYTWGGTPFTPANYQLVWYYSSYGNSLPRSVSNGASNSFSLAVRANGSQYYHLEFGFYFNEYIVLDSSLFKLYINGSVAQDQTQLTYFSVEQPALLGTHYGYIIRANISLTSSTTNLLGFYYTSAPSGQNISPLTFERVYCEYSDSAFSEPDPPRPDDTEFQPLELGSYFTNYKNSNFTTWYQPNQVSNELPFRRYLYNMSSGFDFYCGALVSDWADVLQDNVVLKGSCEVVVADTQGYIVSDDSKFSLARPYFVNQTDPSTTGFEYSVVPSTWDQTITYTKVPLNTFGFKFIVNFYIVIPSTWQTDLSFIPSDIVLLFGGFANSNVDDYIVLFNSYELSYYYRQSSSSPLPDNPNGGFPEQVITPTPVEQISDQFSWLTIQSEDYQDDISQFNETVNQIYTDLNAEVYGSCLNQLYNSLNYSGTSFDFRLPTVTIPFPDSSHTLTLWQEQSIPFRTYIDNLPFAYKLIFGYLVLLSSGSVVFGAFFIHFRRLTRGDITVK